MKNDNTLETHMKTKKHNNETDNRNLKHKTITPTKFKTIIKHKRNRKSKNENGQNKTKQQYMYKNNGCKF